jgi:hypothetical protein
MDIDISNPPDFDVAPIELYTTVMPDDDEFAISAFDIGVVEQVVVSEVPLPKPMPERKQYKPRVKKPVTDDSEFVPVMLQLSERLLGTTIGKLAKVVHEKIEFPEVSTFFALLASASCSVSMAYATQYSTDSCVSLGMYVIIEQPPAMMKSYLLDVGMKPYRLGVAMHNKKVGGINREMKERDIPAEQHLKRTFSETSDGTSASIDGFLSGCSEGRFVVSSAEQSGLISLFPESGSFSSTNELVLKGYASEYVSGMRSGRKAFTGMVQGCIVIIAQPGSSKRVLAASGGSGMAERFIYLAEPDPIGFRRNEGHFPTRREKEAFEQACGACVDIYSASALKHSGADEDERVVMDPENLIRIKASEEGYRILREAKNSTESYLYDLKMAGEMVMMGWLAKIETHVMKIAGNIHVIECISNNCKVAEVIPTWIIEESIDLVLTLSEHIKEILNSAGESGSQAEEETIIEILTRAPMEKRAAALQAKNRKPFKAMPASFKMAGARIDSMLLSGQLVLNAAGKVAIA